ncbi:MAG: CbiX/SirB N-terminal domain-containing protein [Proteobacteria bacterium]|nr:CbiX/SirB N-terminal domain-containing protein [Pseudomonadota bacterium]
MGEGSAAVILLGHGSRLPEANHGLDGVAREVAELLGGSQVEVAFLQLARPGLAEAADRCVAAGARSVAIVPFFLFAGAHVRDDIPQELERLRSRHPGIQFRVAPVLGGHPKLAEAAAERAQEAMAWESSPREAEG